MHIYFVSTIRTVSCVFPCKVTKMYTHRHPFAFDISARVASDTMLDLSAPTLVTVSRNITQLLRHWRDASANGLSVYCPRTFPFVHFMFRPLFLGFAEALGRFFRAWGRWCTALHDTQSSRGNWLESYLDAMCQMRIPPVDRPQMPLHCPSVKGGLYICTWKRI